MTNDTLFFEMDRKKIDLHERRLYNFIIIKDDGLTFQITSSFLGTVVALRFNHTIPTYVL
jgi:hypothetical protein